MYHTLDRLLDNMVQPKLNFGSQILDAFVVCQVLGGLAGVATAMFAANLLSLSMTTMGGVCTVTVTVAALLFSGIRVPMQRSRFLLWIRRGVHHYLVLTVAVLVLFLGLMGQPRLPYMDAWVLGVAVMQIGGRVGCLMAGCCHGRPYTWGVRYGERHLAAGHFNYLTGIRLFPVQLFEACWLAIVVMVAFLQILRGSQPGEILSWYFVAHALGRFHFEFLRADTVRVFVWNFSEAQWFAVMTGVLVAGLELIDVLPIQWWLIILAMVPAACMVGVAISRKVWTGYAAALRQPHHFRQLIGAIKWSYHWASNFDQTGVLPALPTVATTSLGIRISAKRIPRNGSIMMQFDVADQNEAMPVVIARKICDLIVRVTHPAQTVDLEASSDGGYRIRLEGVTTLDNLGPHRVG